MNNKVIPSHGLFQDLTNLVFSRLKVISYAGRIGANNQWSCECKCGSICIVSGGNLKSNHTQSCGCLHKERTLISVKTHGMTKSHEYKTWAGMLSRCYNKNNTNYHNYGQRGITVCDEWIGSFELFFVDMGKKPNSNYSIERIENNKGYSPDNCKWATAYEQANNKRNNHLITINGVEKNLTQWSLEFEIGTHIIYQRLKIGLTGDDLIKSHNGRGRHVTFKGITDNYVGWSKRTGLTEDTISQRIRRGWTIGKTLTIGAN